MGWDVSSHLRLPSRESSLVGELEPAAMLEDSFLLGFLRPIIEQKGQFDWVLTEFGD